MSLVAIGLVDPQGNQYQAGTPPGEHYDIGTGFDDRQPTTSDRYAGDTGGGQDVEYIDYTPDPGSSSSGGSARYAAAGPSPTSPGMIAVGVAGVLVIAYWFWTKAG